MIDMIRRCMQNRALLMISWTILLLIILLTYMKGPHATEKQFHSTIKTNGKDIFQKVSPEYDFNQSLIFVGGPPRSGTTLMRAMLDAHPDIRCGPETHVIPRLLDEWREWIYDPLLTKLFEEGGVVPDVLDDAMAKFILAIIIKHGPPSKHYCNKDPYVLTETGYMHHLFPNAKFILMIRDGRASAHSIVSRKVPISGINIKSYRDVLTKWNQAIERMYRLCGTVGKTLCLAVHYEQLVLQPVATTLRIFQFLNITWRDEVLYHERHLNGTKLSPLEFSSDQVRKPLYLNALTEWFGSIPTDVQRDMSSIAPMLRTFGYNPDNPTPYYGPADHFVMEKMKQYPNTKFVKPNPLKI